LRQETGGRALEDVFIALTRHSIREAEAAPVDRVRMMRQVARPPVNAVFILWLRQLKRYFRSRARMIGSKHKHIVDAPARSRTPGWRPGATS